MVMHRVRVSDCRWKAWVVYIYFIYRYVYVCVYRMTFTTTYAINCFRKFFRRSRFLSSFSYTWMKIVFTFTHNYKLHTYLHVHLLLIYLQAFICVCVSAHEGQASVSPGANPFVAGSTWNTLQSAMCVYVYMCVCECIERKIPKK